MGIVTLHWSNVRCSSSVVTQRPVKWLARSSVTEERKELRVQVDTILRLCGNSWLQPTVKR